MLTNFLQKKLVKYLAIVGLLASSVAGAEKFIEIGNPNAPKGGTFYNSFGVEPSTLNPFSSGDVYSQIIHGYTFDSLLRRNIDTYEFEPLLAESYEVSKDGMTFTFKLRKTAKFHDGTPVTAEDVKFSFDAIRDPAFHALSLLPYFENIEKAEVIDPHTIKFVAKKKYFGNLSSVGTMLVVPKAFYKDPKNKKTNKTIIGSGPYKLGQYLKGKSIALDRNKEWWGWEVPHLKNSFNFDRIVYRFVAEENVSLEMLKRGDLDILALTPEQFLKKAVGKPFGETVIKQKVENKSVKSYGFVGWNLKNPLFQSRDVRVALAHLMNRELMNEKFRYGMSMLATGPWYQQSPYANPNVKPFEFNPDKAAKLLKADGWADTDKDGVLDKVINGKKTPFRFTLMFANKDSEKYFTLYKEDLKKAGIEMNLKVIEWNSFVKALDEQSFEAVSLGWGGGFIDNDPKQIWHSESASAGGSNFISYKNPKVDKLIDQGRQELDRNKRIKIYQQIYKEIAEDAPYAFLFNDRYNLYGHSNRVQMEKPTYNYDIGTEYWWITK